MWTSLIVLLTAALLTAAVAYWVLRAYRRSGGGKARSAMIVCGVTALVALGAYIAVGRPELPDAAYAERIEALKQRDPRTFTQEEALVMWREIAIQHPDDPLPQFYAAEILMDQDRAREAAGAYEQALRRAPENPDALIGLGRALLRIEGALTPEALALFEQASRYTDDPTPWIYQAMAAMESGRNDDARRFWSEAYTRMPAEDPRREMARRMSRGQQ